LLATFDPIGGMAGADADKLDSLLTEVSPSNSAVTELLDSLAHQHRNQSNRREPTRFRHDQILVEFSNEQDQAAWLEKLTREGLKCRSLIS
jgi:hypothetical protein